MFTVHYIKSKLGFPSGNIELRRDAYGERHQRCPALNHMCNQSKLTARRQVRVTSRPGCLKARDVQPAPAFCHSAKLSVCVSRMCSMSLLLSKLGNKNVCSNKERQRKTRSRHVEGILCI